jgi:hypothetical protein
MNKLVKEELDAMKYLLGYQRGKVISEQSQVTSTPAAAPTTAPATVEDVIKQIQTTLNTKYGTKLTVDGKWGNLTQTAFETAIKSKATTPKATGEITPPSMTGTTLPTVTVTGATAPAAAIAAAPQVPLPSVNTPAAPGVSGQPTPAAAPTTPAAENPDDVVGTEVAQPTRRDQRRERQDMRRSNRRAMQDLRAQQRGQ